MTQESLFCHQREPLFFKSGKSDIFRSKKFAMSLFRAIFAFGNGREIVLNGINLTLFCAKKQKRNGNYNKENDAEDVHPGVQVRSSELLL
ncbi:MAG: hypothetical protein IKH97_01460, partial [Bacteroidales bacterium]|nr:hypothetical protein [Bacteroidales bacterium]